MQRAGFQHVLRDAVSPAASDDHLGRPALPELRLEELPHLVRELPPLCGLRGDAVLGHALGLLVPVSFLALVPIQLARDGRNRAADPGGCLLVFCLHKKKKVYRQRLNYSTSREARLTCQPRRAKHPTFALETRARVLSDSGYTTIAVRYYQA